MLTHSELIAPTPDRPETPSEAGLPPRPATPASTNPPPPTPPVQQPPTRAVRQRVTNARPPPLGSLTLRAKSGFDFAMHRPFHRDGGASGAARDRSPCRGCVRRVDRRWRGLCDGFASGWGGGGVGSGVSAGDAVRLGLGTGSGRVRASSSAPFTVFLRIRAWWMGGMLSREREECCSDTTVVEGFAFVLATPDRHKPPTSLMNVATSVI